MINARRTETTEERQQGSERSEGRVTGPFIQLAKNTDYLEESKGKKDVSLITVSSYTLQTSLFCFSGQFYAAKTNYSPPWRIIHTERPGQFCEPHFRPSGYFLAKNQVFPQI